MDRKHFVWAGLALLVLAGGCSTTVPSTDFIAKYTSNINVQNTSDSNLPVRVFYGSDGEYFVLKDIVPYSQGGGLLGTTVVYRCPAGAMPRNFPAAFKPGDVVIDGRPGTKYTYMIQWYRANGGEDRPPANEWVGGQPPETRVHPEFKAPKQK